MSKKVIGIDISKLTFDVAFQIEGKWKYHNFPNETKGFKKFLTVITEADHCVMEASGPYYLRLATFLYDHGINVSVVNPLTIKRFAQMKLVRAKTDKKDAQVIADYGISQQVSFWKPSGEITLKMQQINTMLGTIQKQKTMLKNQLEAFISSGIIDIELKKSLKAILTKLEREQKKAEARLEELVDQHYAASFQRLKEIPGIGKKTAILLIAITDNFKKFDNYKQLIAYVGFSPRIFQSGTSVRGKGHICKMGKSQSRKLLYMCAWSAKKCNKACIQMYERLKAKGKPERVIKIALANKLLKQAFAIAKYERKYQENYISNPCF